LQCGAWVMERGHIEQPLKERCGGRVVVGGCHWTIVAGEGAERRLQWPERTAGLLKGGIGGSGLLWASVGL
jgi:hypothetical protein